jgi:phage protein D
VEIDRIDMTGARRDLVSEVVVTKEPDTLDHAAVRLANPFPMLPWTHGPYPVREGSGITIALGYEGRLTRVFDGEITMVTASFPEDGPSTVRIEAYSRLHRLRGAPRTHTFVDMTDGQIAEQIARDADLSLDADDPGVLHPHVVQYNETDLAFLLDRARRNRYHVWVDGRTLHFKRGGESGPPVVKFSWRAQDEESRPQVVRSSRNARDVAPLRSFNAVVNALKPVPSVVVRGLDPLTRDPIEAQADMDPPTIGPPAIEDRVIGTRLAYVFGARGLTVVDRPVASADEASSLASALYIERAQQFVTGTGTTVGMPELAAGSVVELRGLGRFSGHYFVNRCTHTFGPNGFLTTFAVRSDSVRKPPQDGRPWDG